MKVTLIPYRRGTSSGNIMWKGKFEMRAGKFPKDHPVGGGSVVKKDPLSFDQSQFGSSDKMEAFRARGYWASCFPEGDGITFTHEAEKDDTTVAKDIGDCFGWEVTTKP